MGESGARAGGGGGGKENMFFLFCSEGWKSNVPGSKKPPCPGQTAPESKRPGVGGEKSTRLPKIGEIRVDLNMGGGEKTRSPRQDMGRMRAASILQSSKAREAEKAGRDKGGRETRPADVPRPWEPVEPSHHHPFASL